MGKIGSAPGIPGTRSLTEANTLASGRKTVMSAKCAQGLQERVSPAPGMIPVAGGF